jgi:hypothetical protein
MNQTELNDFDLLVSKFKDKSGLITATVISKKGIARSETPQYRRDLLQMAVEQGYASSNGKHPNHNKYGIDFNDKNRVKVIVEKTFDSSVLDPVNFIDLPPHSLKNGLNIIEIESCNAPQVYWLSVYQLLCGFQVEGKINLELLPAWYYPDLKGEISLMARRLIVIYKILKLGWSELEKHFPLGKCGYNVMFQKIFQSKSAHLLKKSSIKIIDRPRTQLDYLRELRDRKAELSAIDRQTLARKFMGNNFDTFRQIHLNTENIFGNDMFIKYMFRFTQNSDIKKRLVELDKLNEDVKTSAIKILRRKNDKDRTRKFEEKVLKHLSKTLDPDSMEFLEIDRYIKTLGSES